MYVCFVVGCTHSLRRLSMLEQIWRDCVSGRDIETRSVVCGGMDIYFIYVRLGQVGFELEADYVYDGTHCGADVTSICKSKADLQ